MLWHVVLTPMHPPAYAPPFPCSKLTRLRRLEVCGGGVTEAGVAHFASLAGLQHLSLAQVGCGWEQGRSAYVCWDSAAVQPCSNRWGRGGRPSAAPARSSSLAHAGSCAMPQNHRLGNGAIGHLLRLNELTALNLSQSKVSSQAVVALGCLPNLQASFLFTPQCTSSGAGLQPDRPPLPPPHDFCRTARTARSLRRCRLASVPPATDQTLTQADPRPSADPGAA